MVDDITRLDSATRISGNSFLYSYTITSLEARQIDTAKAKKVLMPNIISNIKTNPKMKIFRENKVTLIYNYKDKNGEYFFSVYATPADYSGN